MVLLRIDLVCMCMILWVSAWYYECVYDILGVFDIMTVCDIVCVCDITSVCVIFIWTLLETGLSVNQKAFLWKILF